MAEQKLNALWLKEKKNKYQCPSLLLDLNPIEYLWKRDIKLEFITGILKTWTILKKFVSRNGLNV